MKVKTINFKEIKDNNFILSPSYYLENKKTQQGDGSEDLNKCKKCKNLVEDKYLYSEAESEKEYCFSCFPKIIDTCKEITELEKEKKKLIGVVNKGGLNLDLETQAQRLLTTMKKRIKELKKELK